MFELRSFTELPEIFSSGILLSTVIFFEMGLKNELIFEEGRFLSVFEAYEIKENVIV